MTSGVYEFIKIRSLIDRDRKRRRNDEFMRGRIRGISLKRKAENVNIK